MLVAMGEPLPIEVTNEKIFLKNVRIAKRERLRARVA